MASHYTVVARHIHCANIAVHHHHLLHLHPGSKKGILLRLGNWEQLIKVHNCDTIGSRNFNWIVRFSTALLLILFRELIVSHSVFKCCDCESWKHWMGAGWLHRGCWCCCKCNSFNTFVLNCEKLSSAEVRNFDVSSTIGLCRGAH